MHEIDFSRDLVIILGAAVVVVALLRRLGVPSIAGYIFTGALAGPNALRLIEETRQVEILAEVGVILLLFGIGLELSLERLRRLWKAILLGGGVQVTVTIASVTAAAIWFGLAPGTAIFLGCVIAVSSTAVVLRGLATRGELEAPHGRLAVGILVFQDLCVVPMVLAVPFLSGSGVGSAEILSTAVTAVVILLGVVLASMVLVPPILAAVARTRERDLFILTVFLVCFGTAWALSLAGISLALGAFLAGLVVAGSEFRHQALVDLIPAREVLASLFFVSIGMLLDLSDVLENLMPTVALLVAILFGKFAIIMGTALVLRLPLQVGIVSAATLCQVGEFSFVLLKAAAGTQLLVDPLAHNLLVAIILSMLFTPVAIAFAPHLASNAARVPWLNSLLEANPPGIEAREPHCDHVVVAGYGLAGRSMCQALRSQGIAYVAVDLNPDNVRLGRSNGDRVVLGDVTQREVVQELGCQDAMLVVIAINNVNATVQATRTIRDAFPGVTIIARAVYQLDEEALIAAGATRVVTAESSAADALVNLSLRQLNA